MKLTKAAEYAIRCLLFLADKPEGVVTPRKTIARGMDIPEHYLGKIAQQLAQAGLITIAQGRGGGYRLRRPPDRISLLQAVEAMEGQIALNDCLLGRGSCWRDNVCSVHRVWDRACSQLRQTLDGVSFAQLAEAERNGGDGKRIA